MTITWQPKMCERCNAKPATLVDDDSASNDPTLCNGYYQGSQSCGYTCGDDECCSGGWRLWYDYETGVDWWNVLALWEMSGRDQ